MTGPIARPFFSGQMQGFSGGDQDGATFVHYGDRKAKATIFLGDTGDRGLERFFGFDSLAGWFARYLVHAIPACFFNLANVFASVICSVFD